jgi:hypothetical protein
MSSILENLKTIKPLIDTGVQVFLSKPSLNVTPEMKKQREDFLNQFPRPRTSKKKDEKREEELEKQCALYRTIISMYQNEMIAQSRFMDKLQKQLEESLPLLNQGG